MKPALELLLQAPVRERRTTGLTVPESGRLMVRLKRGDALELSELIAMVPAKPRRVTAFVEELHARGLIDVVSDLPRVVRWLGMNTRIPGEEVDGWVPR